MAKGRLLEDTFEQLVELGQSTGKKTVKSVAQTINPLADHQGNESSIQNTSNTLKEKLDNKKNHTPLDFENLQKKFDDKEKLAKEALRNRLFQLVKQGDERLVMENRQKELEKKRKEEMEKQEKKRQEEEKKKKQAAPIPMGKVRRSIFSPKRAAQQQHAEVKPASGKQ